VCYIPRTELPLPLPARSNNCSINCCFFNFDHSGSDYVDRSGSDYIENQIEGFDRSGSDYIENQIEGSGSDYMENFDRSVSD
jgi:hypothetical protein